MNREIAAAGRWGKKEILERADRLADRAVRIWPAPLAGDVTQTDERSEWKRLRKVLASLPAGSWTTYKDLAQVTGAGSAQTVGSYLASRVDLPNAHRVLRANGTPSPDFAWLDGRTDSQQEALEREGVRFEGGVADPAQRLSLEALAALAGLHDPARGAEDPESARPRTDPKERADRFHTL